MCIRDSFDVLLEFAAYHPVAGAKIAALGISGRGVFPDVKLILNLAPASAKLRAKGTHVTWSWGATPKGFVAQVLISCESALARRLTQGKENPALAFDRGDVTLTSLDPSVDERRVLDLLPVSYTHLAPRGRRGPEGRRGSRRGLSSPRSEAAKQEGRARHETERRGGAQEPRGGGPGA